MKAYTKILSFALLSVIFVLSLVSCKKEESIYGGDGDFLKYDPYDNILKDPIDTGDAISVSGKAYAFSDIDVRDASANKQVTAGNALKKLYRDSSFRFTAENKVLFEDDDDDYYFVMNETQGTRSGNVFTVKHTNSDGVSYDVRFEIHTDKIYVIHNGHTYDKEGVFATLTFTLKK